MVVERMLDLFEATKILSQEYIEPIIGSTLETRWEHITQEQVIMRVDCHLVLILTEVLDGVGHS